MSGKKKPKQLPLPGFKVVFRAVITLKNGKKLYARNYGIRGWPILMPE